MKKIRYKLFQPQNDLEVALNQEGSAGWEIGFPLMTPAGAVFVMKQITDEDVSGEDIEAAKKAAHEADLIQKFGVQPVPPPSGGGPRIVR
jgi:hypothetical protein